MPYKNPGDRKAWMRLHHAEYLRAWRRGERRRKTREPNEITRPTFRDNLRERTFERTRENPHVETPKTPSALAKAIYSTPVTKTHRFEIWARLKRTVSPTSLTNVVVKTKGRDGRIQYAEVKLEHSTIEIYSRTAKIYPTTELEGLASERVQGMKDALGRACSFRGLALEPESKWRVGEHSHTTMENEDLNDSLSPLALRNAGDENYKLFKDDGSHPGLVESAGKENWTGTNLLYRVLFELPVENANQIAVFGEQIRLHMTVLKEMGETLKAIRTGLKRTGNDEQAKI